MLISVRKSVTTHGTPESISSYRAIASWATFQADINNTGNIYVGGVGDANPFPAPVSSVVANAVDNGNAYIGMALAPGDSWTAPDIGGATYLDMQYIWVDADTSGDVVVVNYGRR